MKKKILALILFVSAISIANSHVNADRMAELVISEDGRRYHQCINPGSNCAT